MWCFGKKEIDIEKKEQDSYTPNVMSIPQELPKYTEHNDNNDNLISTDVIEMLLKELSIKKEDKIAASFNIAAKKGNFELAKSLLNCNPTLDINFTDNEPGLDQTALEIACQNGHIEIVKLLLQHKDVIICNFPIRTASYHGHFEIVKLLLQDSRVDPSEYDNLAVSFAIYGGHCEIVKLLLQDPRVDPSTNVDFVVRCASKKGYYDIVKLLEEYVKNN
jgi:ankyrin repeat protein